MGNPSGLWSDYRRSSNELKVLPVTARSTVYIFSFFLRLRYDVQVPNKRNEDDKDNEEEQNVMRRFLPLILPLSHLNHKQPENNYN